MLKLSTRAGNENLPVVTQSEWSAARTELLRQEKEFARVRDEWNRQRHELPWEKIEKEYVFDGLNGKQTLGELFDGRSQLIIYHFLFGPARNRCAISFIGMRAARSALGVPDRWSSLRATAMARSWGLGNQSG